MPSIYRDFASQGAIDAQYNPSLALADPDEPGRHYSAAALQARTSLPCVLDLAYGPTRAETLDIFPAAQAQAPVFVFFHGGYWRALSSKEFSGIALGLQPLGITSVVVNYALCPQVTIDEIVRQTRAALAWTLCHIGQHGGDPRRVAIGGHSAGAQLAAMALITEWERDYSLPQDPFAAALLFSGLYDIEALRHSYLQPQIQLDEGLVRRNSPAFLARPCRTPQWITWGNAESSEFARQSALYHQACLAQGNRAELQPMVQANHFSVIHGLEQSNSAVCRWLAQHLQP